MNRTEALLEVLRDDSRSGADKNVARAALDSAQASATDAEIIPAPMVELPEAQRMLAALGKKHVMEISEGEWESHFDKNHSLPSETLIREWRYFVPPSERMLWLLNGGDRVAGLQWYWKTVLDTCGGREDVKAHVWRQLSALT